MQHFTGFCGRHSTEIRIFLTAWVVYLFHLGPISEANENRDLDLVRVNSSYASSMSKDLYCYA
jgi:hypothetical protein